MLITHYQRLLDYVPDSYTCMHDGRVKSGDKNLALELEDKAVQAR